MKSKDYFKEMVILSAVILAVVGVAFPASAAIPQTLSYQGKLADPVTRLPVADGTYNIRFRIYDAQSSGELLWQESQNVSVQDGIISVLLGSNSALDLPFDREYWLSVQVGIDAEMSRRKISSVAYSFNAKMAESVKEGVINTDHIANSAVTADKIAPNVVSSINNTSNDGGNIDLVAGENITIVANDAADTITISAAGASHSRYTDTEARAAADDITSWGHTSVVTNLNADRLDGYHASSFSAGPHISSVSGLSGGTITSGVTVSGTTISNKFYVSNAGNANAIYGQNSSSSYPTIWAKNTTGGSAGYFGGRISSVAGSTNALNVENSSSSYPTIYAKNLGVGKAGHFDGDLGCSGKISSTAGNTNALNVENSSSSYPTIYAENLGGDSAGYFGGSISSVAGNTNALNVENSSSSYPTVWAENLGGGYAGYFDGGLRCTGNAQVDGSTTSDKFYVSDAGDSNAIRGQNSSSSYPTVWAKNTGGGSAGYFDGKISSTTGNSNALNVDNTSSSYPTIYAKNFGGGSAGYFDGRISSVAGNTNALNVENNSSSYPTVWAENSGGGSAGYFDGDLRCTGDARVDRTTFSDKFYVSNAGNDNAIRGQNSSSSYPTVWAQNTGGGYAGWFQGDLGCSGAKTAIVSTQSYGNRRLYSDESAEIYFFDRGQGQLIYGEVRIKLDPMFLETVTINDKCPLLVQVTATANCNGLFVAKKTADSFTISELNGGTSTATFDWEVAAKRSGYEAVRMEEVASVSPEATIDSGQQEE